MQRIEVNTSGFKLTREVPSSIEEYNTLAKRENAVLDDAIANTLYRGVFAEFRAMFVEAVAEETGIAVINHGTEDEPQWESDGKYIKRVIAALGISKDEFVSRFQSKAQSLMDSIAFDPSERERKSDGPKVGKRDKALAEEILAKYTPEQVNAVAAKLSSILNRTVGTDVDSLARALADKRRAEAAALEAKTKAELGL